MSSIQPRDLQRPPTVVLPTDADISSAQALADAMPGLVWVADADGSVTFFNQRWATYTGMTAEQADCGEWQCFLHPDDLLGCLACWHTSVASGQAYETEYRIRHAADGEYRWNLARGTPARDPAGRIVRWFGICTDIHDRKTAEITLQAAKEQSELAGRTKDEFLSILSHELRTPLSAILGWTQLLEMNVLSEDEQREAVQTIKQQAKAQSQLIEDLLDVSRILNGKFHLRSQQVELAYVLTAALKAAKPVAQQAGVTLTSGEFDPSVVVTADPQRLQQIVTNLLANAVKFTPQGGTIDLALSASDGVATVVVRDSGMGIPVDQIEEIFERFKQVGGAALRDKGGLGLGLSIVKHVVDAHGGTIRARSEGAGQGSSFEMRLPILATPGLAGHSTPSIDIEPAAAALAGLRVLVVDDEESARTVIATAVRKAGAEVRTARDSTEAWSMLSAGPYDVLVSDVGMPGENGLDLIERVRRSTAVFREIPALALTGFASVDDQTRALAAGFQLHVAKPVEPPELVRRVAAIGRKTAGK